MTKTTRQMILLIVALLLFLGLLVGNPMNLAAESVFRTPVIITNTSPGTFFVVVSDLDKDGDIDVVVASSANDSVTWYENIGATGEVWVPHIVTTVADGVVGVRVADIDRDGDLDIVSASTLDDKLRWHENLLGDGDLWSDHSVGVDIDGIIGIVVEDFDQDLDWDVAAVSNIDNQVLWFENTTGDASDGMVHLIAANALGVFPLEKGDLDGDGDEDLISGWSNGVLAWHENVKNQGGSWANHVIGSNLGNIRSIAVDDINGDGTADVAVAVSDTDSIFWFQSIDISQGIWHRNTITTVLDGVVFIDTVDLDNDGDIDVLAAADIARNFVVFDNGSGVGSNWSGSVISSPSLGGVHPNMTNGPRVIRHADVNGDGFQDIITGSYWGQTVSVMIQQVSASASNASIATPTPETAATPTSTPVVAPSQSAVEEIAKPPSVVVKESDMILVDPGTAVVEIVHPTSSVTITAEDQCASLKVGYPSWESTYQVKLTSDGLESIPLRVHERSLCVVDIRTYDTQAVSKDKMELWQSATIAIPLSNSIITQLSGYGINGIEGIMDAIADRRLIFMKRHRLESPHWVPIATHMDFLNGSVTTNQTRLAGTYALMLLDEPMPVGYVLPSVGVKSVPSIVNVFGGVGFLVILAGVIFWVRSSRRYGFN